MSSWRAGPCLVEGKDRSTHPGGTYLSLEDITNRSPRACGPRSSLRLSLAGAARTVGPERRRRAIRCPWHRFPLVLGQISGNHFQLDTPLFPGNFPEISCNLSVLLCRGSKSQVLSTSFWQGLHFSRCRRVNSDMGRVWRLPGDAQRAIFSMTSTFLHLKTQIFARPQGHL